MLKRKLNGSTDDLDNVIIKLNTCQMELKTGETNPMKIDTDKNALVTTGNVLESEHFKFKWENEAVFKLN